MAIKKSFSVALDPQEKETAEKLAGEKGMNFSTYVEKCLRDARIRAAGRKHREIMANLSPQEAAVITNHGRVINASLMRHEVEGNR